MINLRTIIGSKIKKIASRIKKFRRVGGRMAKIQFLYCQLQQKQNKKQVDSSFFLSMVWTILWSDIIACFFLWFEMSWDFSDSIECIFKSQSDSKTTKCPVCPLKSPSVLLIFHPCLSIYQHIGCLSFFCPLTYYTSKIQPWWLGCRAVVS